MPARPGMEEARVPIPLGAGVDDGTDEFLLEAPFSAVVEDMRPDKAGMYRKRPGWTEVYAADAADNPLLVGGVDEVLVLGNATPTRVLPTGDVPLGFGAPVPVTVTLDRLLASKGFVHSVQCAHSGTYTAVMVSYSGDVTANLAGPYTAEGSVVCDMMIFDADGALVWGPYTDETLQACPRVEPIRANTFVFFAAGFGGFVTLADDSLMIDGTPSLRYTVGVVGGGAPAAAASLGLLWPSQSAENKVYKLYDTDTSWPGQSATSRAFVTFPERIAGPTKQIVVASLGPSGVLDTYDQATFASSNGHLACHYHAASTSLFVLDGEDAYVTSYDPAGLAAGPVTGVAAPSLAGIDTATTLPTGLGAHTPTPVWYLDEVGALYLNEVPVTVTGTDGGTPAFGTAEDERLPHLYEPVVFADRTLFSFSYGSQPGTIGQGGDTVELYHLDDTHSSGAALPVVDVTLAETRHGVRGVKLFTFWTYTAAGTPRESPCVTGQVSVLSDGQILVPLSFLTSVQKDRASTVDPALYDVANEPSVAVQGGAGYYNDESVVALARVSVGAALHSSLRYEDGALVAAGMLSSWSGPVIHAAGVRPCTVTDIDLAPPTDTRKVSRQSVGVNDLSAATNPPDYTCSYYCRVVLVTTDPSGVEFRSAPSRAILQQGIGGDGVDWKDYCPSLSLTLHPQHLAMLGDRRVLDAEVYVTERVFLGETGPTTEEGIDETTYTMVNRIPVQEDDAGFFVVDTLQDFVFRNTASLPTITLDTGWPSPPHTNPLYTLVEAEAVHPPAMHVLSQAGNYMFGLAAEDPYEVWFSKPLTKGRAPEWSPLLTFQAPSTSGGVISLAGTYDRLFLICRDGVWEMPALDGPDAAGSGTFPAARLVYRGERCVGHAGTVQTPRGTFYITPSGPHLLSDGGDADIGRRVEDQIDWTDVRAAVYRPTTDEVSWFTDTGSCHLALGSMAFTTSAAAARAAARVDDDLYVVWGTGVGATPDGSVYIEDRDSHRDPSAIVYPTSPAYILGRVVSPWFSLEDAHGFKRFVGISVLGRLNTTPTRGRLTVTLAYDYVDTEVDTFTWTAAELAALGKGLQLLVKPSRQKTTAVRVTIYESTWAPGVGEVGADTPTNLDWSLVRLELRVRTKTGLLKLEQGAKQ